MKRWIIPLAAAGLLLLCWALLHLTSWFFADREGAAPGRPSHVKTADPMDTPSGWRYRQNQPHHWRYIMLQN